MPVLRWRKQNNVWIGTGSNDADVTGNSPAERNLQHKQEGLGGNDRLTGASNLLNCIFGGAGDDTIGTGTNANLCAYGGTGNDQITGGTDNDRLHGDQGIDTIWAGQGNDYIVGDSGGDELRGEEGNDKIYASRPKHVVFFNTEWPAMDSEYATDRILGGPGSDTIWGGGGGLNAFGGADNDRLCATNNDTLSGGPGDDEFFLGLRDPVIHRTASVLKAYGGQDEDRFYVDDTKAYIVEAFGDGGDDTFVSRTAQRNHFVGGYGADAFVMESSFAHGQRIYYYDYRESTSDDSDYIIFKQGVTGTVNIMLDELKFGIVKPTVRDASNGFIHLTYLDRDFNKLNIIMDKDGKYTTELF
jgi:Ca2+-binding RTX toxin-like protein